MKILLVSDGANFVSLRQKNIRYESDSLKFVLNSIVPMERKTISIDTQLAVRDKCRVGVNEILIML